MYEVDCEVNVLRAHLQPVPPRRHLRRTLVEPVGGERARRAKAAHQQNILGAGTLPSLVPRAVHKLLQRRGSGNVGGCNLVFLILKLKFVLIASLVPTCYRDSKYQRYYTLWSGGVPGRT